MERPIKTKEIREAFLKFFESKQHTRVASSSLIPENDPTLLFTNAGMVQFKDCFLGIDKRSYNRATSSQKCVRAGGKHNDLENVGFTSRHHTFFEMLGNFSFGDYFKKEAISYAWEFVTQVLKLPPEKLRVSVFEKDDESAEIWHKEIGLPLDKIVRFGEKDNFWAMGDTGPCGPCTEIFWDQGKEVDGDRWLEFWNCVFMQFDRKADGTLVPLAKPSVDTGMGLERMAAVMQGVPSNYDIDLMQSIFKGVHKYIETITQTKLNVERDSKEESALRVIVDHLRSTSFLIADGILPSSEGRGYVLRRILRRAVRFGKQLGLTKPFLSELYPLLKNEMSAIYPELASREKIIKDILFQEEEKFFETLDKGLHLLENAFAQSTSDKKLNPEVVFKLYDTFGFPVDLTELIAREKGYSFDNQQVNQLMESQQERSRASWKGSGSRAVDPQIKEWKSKNIFPKLSFYESSENQSVILAASHSDGQSWVSIEPCPFYAESGGQVSDAGYLEINNKKLAVLDVQKIYDGGVALLVEDVHASLKAGVQVKAVVDDVRRGAIRANHTATHLLHAALRKVLGEHVAQAGSVVDEKRLRFDFSHPKSLSAEELLSIENDVNEKIAQDIELSVKNYPIEEAKKLGAMALFGEKYGDQVRVVNIPKASMELCGGLHVKKTGDISYFKIISEGGVASGTRRIEAITKDQAIQYFKNQEQILKKIAQTLKSPIDYLLPKVESLLEGQKQLEKEIHDLKRKIAQGVSSSNEKTLQATYLNNPLVIHIMEGVDMSILRERSDFMRQNQSESIHVLWAPPSIMVTANPEKIKNFHCGKFLSSLCTHFGGKGGGQEKSAQGQLALPAEGHESVLNWVKSQ